MNYTCSGCGGVTKVYAPVFRLKKKSGLPSPCGTCAKDLHTYGSRIKLGKSDSQKRSARQEKKAAQRVGGYVTPASGAGSIKGDVRVVGHSRIECKLTRAKSFTLKLSELEKLEGEASLEERPVFEIEFQGVSPPKRYVVLPGWAYDALQEDYG